MIWQRAETEAKTDPSAHDAEQMLADYDAATTAFEHMGARPYVARTLRVWGNALRSLGKTDEGDEKLRRALALFDEMGITREASEVRAELAA